MYKITLSVLLALLVSLLQETSGLTQTDRMADLEGEFVIELVDEPGGRSSVRNYVKMATGTEVVVKNPTKTALPHTSGFWVRLTGHMTSDSAGEEFFVLDKVQEAYDPSMVAGPVVSQCEEPVLIDSLCRQSLAVIVARTNPNIEVDLDFYAESSNSLDEFYRQNSFGATWFTGLSDEGQTADIIGPVDIELESCSLSSARIAAIAALGQSFPEFDRYDYRRIAYVVKQDMGCSGAHASLGGQYSTYFGFQQDTFHHELGHNLGQRHAGGLADNCPFGYVGLENCDHMNYGDGFDVMGTSSGHFNGARKEMALWLAEENVIELSGSGVGSYSVAPLEWASDGPQIVKIPYEQGGDPNKFYYFSYRSDLAEGQLDVHYAPFTEGYGANQPDTLRIDSLHVGQTYSDELMELTVRLDAIDEEGAHFTIERGQCLGTPSTVQEDCDGNGLEDQCEIFRGWANDGDDDSVPDVCEVERYYVDPLAQPPFDGQSWTHAYPSLQSALELATLSGSVREIWLAEGIYKPERRLPAVLGGSESFHLTLDLNIYGGFAGFENTIAERDWQHNDAKSILSCDLSVQGEPNDNCHRPLTIDGPSTVLLDGLDICDGNANGILPSEAQNGGGIRSQDVELTLQNTIVRNNTALAFGGAIHASGGTLTIVNSILSGNRADGIGSALYHMGEASHRLDMTNSTIVNNQTDGSLGVTMISLGGQVQVLNSIFWENGTGEEAGEGFMLLGVDPTIDYSIVAGWTGSINGVGTFDADPLLANLKSGDLHLRGDSPAINAGAPDFIPSIPIDIEGNPRICDSRVDLGAYESCTNCPADFDGDESVGVFDLTYLLGRWGPCFSTCDADLNNDGSVNFADLSLLLVQWGDCL